MKIRRIVSTFHINYGTKSQQFKRTKFSGNYTHNQSSKNPFSHVNAKTSSQQSKLNEAVEFTTVCSIFCSVSCSRMSLTLFSHCFSLLLPFSQLFAVEINFFLSRGILLSSAKLLVVNLLYPFVSLFLNCESFFPTNLRNSLSN